MSWRNVLPPPSGQKSTVICNICKFPPHHNARVQRLGSNNAVTVPNLTQHLFHSYNSLTLCKNKCKTMAVIIIKYNYYLGGMGSLLAKVSLDCRKELSSLSERWGGPPGVVWLGPVLLGSLLSCSTGGWCVLEWLSAVTPAMGCWGGTLHTTVLLLTLLVTATAPLTFPVPPRWWYECEELDCLTRLALLSVKLPRSPPGWFLLFLQNRTLPLT
jgi:hypothetical protein